MKSELTKLTDSIDNLIRIKKPVIWINTLEEEEVQIALKNYFDEKDYENVMVWSQYVGSGKFVFNRELNTFEYEVEPGSQSPMGTLIKIDESNKEDEPQNAFILKDIHGITKTTPMFVRGMRDVREKNLLYYKPVIVIAPSSEIPTEWTHMCEVLSYENPNLEEIVEIVELFASTFSVEIGDVEAVAKTLEGFSRKEAINILKLSIGDDNVFNMNNAHKRKIEILEASGMLTYKEPETSMAHIGGNDNFKSWVEENKICMSQRARDLGIPRPKGYLALGIPGSSKTFAAEALAGDMGYPFLKMDMSKILSKMVGESERNADRVIKLIQSCAPCVLLIDEVEKMLGGVNSSNSSDSGVVARIFGKILDFLNDNSGVYVVMTSNDVSQLPPELTRTGRLDAIFYFGLPNKEEREAILDIHFNKSGHAIDKSKLTKAIKESNGYTGAELEQVVKNSLKKAFVRSVTESKEFEVKETDILAAIKTVTPLSQSYKENIRALNAWAKNRVLYASAPEKKDEGDINLDELL